MTMGTFCHLLALFGSRIDTVKCSVCHVSNVSPYSDILTGKPWNGIVRTAEVVKGEGDGVTSRRATETGMTYLQGLPSRRAECPVMRFMPRMLCRWVRVFRGGEGGDLLLPFSALTSALEKTLILVSGHPALEATDV